MKGPNPNLPQYESARKQLKALAERAETAENVYGAIEVERQARSIQVGLIRSARRDIGIARQIIAHCCAIRIRAERRLGELLESQGRKPGQRGSAPSERDQAIRQSSQPVRELAQAHGISERRVRQIIDTPEVERPPTLQELGLSKTRAAKVKAFHRMARSDFEQSLAELEAGIGAGLMRPTTDLIRAKERAERPPEPPARAYILEEANPDIFQPQKIPEPAHVIVLSVPERLPSALECLKKTGARYTAMFVYHPAPGQVEIGVYGSKGNPMFESQNNFRMAVEGAPVRFHLPTVLARVTGQPTARG